MFKIIIVSGPDNCGKDTACEQLKAILQNEAGLYPVYVSSKFSKLVYDWPGEMKHLKKFAEDFVNADIPNAVLLLNRSWLDEGVYGPLYRDYTSEDIKWLYEDLNCDMGYFNVVYVNLTAPLQVLVAREDGKSFSNGTPEKITAELEKFAEVREHLINGTNCSIIDVDTAEVSIEDMGRVIYNAINIE